ncbi:hypothetical protein HK101_000628 [Irineochytrium annulatum]|nr:hypothetical protein HK101_000628 [Irineochytrium annulatum]
MFLASALLALAAASSALADYQVDIYLTVDDNYKIYPSDGVNVNHDWQTIDHHTYEVPDGQPFLVSIDAFNNAGIAGVGAVVKVDGRLYAATRPGDNHFKFSHSADLTSDSRWQTDILFDDSAWSTIATGTGFNAISLICDNAAQWGNLPARLQTTANVVIPDMAMAWPWSCESPHTNTSVRLVIQPPPKRQVDVWITVDDTFHLTFNGQVFDPQGPNWMTLSHYTTYVADDQELVIGVAAQNYNGIGGMSMAVKVDGEIFSATQPGYDNMRFLDHAPAAGWNTDVNFDDNAWMRMDGARVPEVAGVSVWCKDADQWGNMPAQISNSAGVNSMAFAWPYSCDRQNTQTWARVVVPRVNPVRRRRTSGR